MNMLEVSTTVASHPRRGRPAGTSVPDPIDVHVGARVRLRRTQIAMSQDKLARLIGISFQQLQKYENGANRISASRFVHLSRALGVPVSWFFEGIGNGNTPAEPDPTQTREAIELVRAYNSIQDPKLRRRAMSLIRAMGKAA